MKILMRTELGQRLSFSFERCAMDSAIDPIVEECHLARQEVQISKAHLHLCRDSSDSRRASRGGSSETLAMALKLEDIINKKKEPNQILDLARVRIRTKEEFEKYYDRIPEFKIRPEKVRPDDVRIHEGEFSFRSSRKEVKGRLRREFSYGDPIPPSMRSVRLEDLAGVEINWRMLTVCRPKTRLEEEIFSRVVELGKLRLGTGKYEARLLASTSHGLSAATAELQSLGIIVSKTKKGTTETKIRTCRECGEELCSGKWCREFPYESYTRMIMDKTELANEEAEELGLRKPRRNSKLPTTPTGIKTKRKLKRRPRKKKGRRKGAEEGREKESD